MEYSFNILLRNSNINISAGHERLDGYNGVINGGVMFPVDMIPECLQRAKKETEKIFMVLGTVIRTWEPRREKDVIDHALKQVPHFELRRRHCD